jgi:hypothetical protein
MKLMVAASLILSTQLVAFAAHAITLKTCVVTNTEKGSSSTTSKTIYLANGRSNFVQAGEQTRLVLSLPAVGQNADVWVNDQLMFIFKGDLSNGTYESAMERGTIQCSAGQNVPFIYQSRPGGITEGSGSYAAMASCYAGDAQAVMADLSKSTRTPVKLMTVDATTSAITVPAIERQCVKGHGTNPDDYVCEKYDNVRVTYKIQNCDYDPTERP